MQSLQDILNNFNSSKLAKLPEGKLRQKMVGINLFNNREGVVENKRLKAVKNSIVIKENARKNYSIHGPKFIQAGKEYSQKKVTCPHCNSVGPQGNMIKFHFDKCKRTAGFSDDKIYELHLQGLRNFEICKLSGLKKDTLSRIIIKYKKNSEHLK
jgi:hypothetical protein